MRRLAIPLLAALSLGFAPLPFRSVKPESYSTTVWEGIGIKAEPVWASEASRTHPKLNGGLRIVEVRADGPASKADLKRGDILVGLHLWETLTLDNVAYVLRHPDRATFKSMKFYFLRHDVLHSGWLDIEE